ncbi:hypothetical protein [Paenibacillus sp. Soil766]|uniref:hypothetical protein n=1 Tax=Paenibacillus sp. Soil766 TaxID=1736404 RepID=UPI000AAAB419|nr:hypothetical protein [Paenibacillus sp. Soil766]
MKLLNVLLVVALGTMFLLLAYQAKAPDSTHDPNPMKHDQNQFARMQLTYYTESVK